MSDMPPKRRKGRPSAQETQGLSRHILDIARLVFFDLGFNKASSEVIAAKAGISKRTLYARYPNKASIFEAVILDEIEAQYNAFEHSVPEEGDVRVRLKKIAEMILSWLLTERTISLDRVAIAEVTRFPDLARNVHQVGSQRPARLVENVLREAIARGEVILDDPKFAAEQFVIIVVFASLRLAHLGVAPSCLNDEVRARIDKAIDLFLDGCGTLDRPADRRGGAP